MNVKLLSSTLNPEYVVAMAGKLCYSDVGVDEIREKTTDDEIYKFIKMLAKMGHHSPLEHATFTFAAEGVSRALTHQLVRHRIASFSQQSQRYVKLNQFEYIMPPSIEKNRAARYIFKKHMRESQIAYDKIVDTLFDDKFEEYKNEHPDASLKDLEKAAKAIEKECIEDARYVFPNACESKIVFTMNVRTLYNFFEHRCCNRSQWEIRNLANKMYKILIKSHPYLFMGAGTSCTNGKCKEGQMSCGKPLKATLDGFVTE